ncbi:PE-PPE domain-containing protein [Mycobacterium sp. M26]|uniref:PE-PPE domain-containing protein n=1 Tax=Mycobacterium sp. M26 TaxID=1762962 RepID=UPI00073EAC84|nr:PE-PPE domain-containing protein [Mycobacterium sp. M26]
MTTIDRDFGRRHRPRLPQLFCLLGALALGFATVAPAQADTVIWVGGTSGTLGRLLGGNDTSSVAQKLLGGRYRNDTVVTVDYPASIWPITGLLDPSLGDSVRTGVAKTKAAIRAALATSSAPLSVVGTSQGAMVVQQVAADLNNDPSVPSNTTFVLIADPNFGALYTQVGTKAPVLDYTPIRLPLTRFRQIEVVNQYDGFAIPIAQIDKHVTVLNALIGIATVHTVAQNTDLSTVPAQNITATPNDLGGVNIVYRVPTTNLPLTAGLRDAGADTRTVDDIDATLRPIIEEGYMPVQPSAAASAAVPTR